MNILYLVPARSGSKGLAGKNTKLLNQKPLISYTLEFALEHLTSKDELCISTDDDAVIDIATALGIQVPFKRPDHLSSDSATTYDVMLHALNHYLDKGKVFDAIMLLQPTSPFRVNSDWVKVLDEFDQYCDMVVTVKESKENPYFNLFEENEYGFLKKSKEGQFNRRQECPLVYAFNGSIYLIRVSSIIKSKITEFEKVKKVVMPHERSIDIDTFLDFTLAEAILKTSLK